MPLQCAVAACSVPSQCAVAVCSVLLQCADDAVCRLEGSICSLLQRCNSVLQCVVVVFCCSVLLQCAVALCSVLLQCAIVAYVECNLGQNLTVSSQYSHNLF